MKLVGMMLCRNEDWVLGMSARVALMWCDALVILLHNCTDRSSEIALEISREHPSRVLVLTQHNPKWDEMKHRDDMLTAARYTGATHCAIIDADEILTANLLPDIRRHVLNTPVGNMLQLPGYNLRGGLKQYHSTGIWSNRWFSLAFQDASKYHWGGDRFHHREPLGERWRQHSPVLQGAGGIMHLWGASERRLRAKHAWYKLTERLRWPSKPVGEIDRIYSMAVHGTAPGDRPADWAFATVPGVEWLSAYQALFPHLHLDTEPWQIEECRKMVAANPGIWRGLDLFGVV